MGCGSCNTKKNKKSSCANCNRYNKFFVFDWLSNITPHKPEVSCSIVEVSFKGGRKKYYNNKNNWGFKMGDPVVVKCNNNTYDIGVISLKGELVRLQLRRKSINSEDIEDVLRIPTQHDLDVWHKVISLEKTTMLKARKIVQEFQLSMKITDVEYQADGKRAIFYYLADKRIDFRELIKVFSRKFNLKTIMRQVGARQEAGIVGGIGSCGRELCCASWLRDTRAVNIAAARYQNLSLNSQKISGQCGKLKCCLNYELQNYIESLKEFPNKGKILKTKRGNAVVQKIDIFKKIIWYSYVEKEHDWIMVELHAVKKMLALNKEGSVDFEIEDFILQNK